MKPRGDYEAGWWTLPVFTARGVYTLERYVAATASLRGAAVDERNVAYMLKLHGQYIREVTAVVNDLARRERCDAVVAMCGHGTAQTNIEQCATAHVRLRGQWSRHPKHLNRIMDWDAEARRVAVEIIRKPRRVLLIDDICRKGESLAFARRHLEAHGVRVGALFACAVSCKPHEMQHRFDVRVPMTHVQRYQLFLRSLPRDGRCESCGRTPAEAGQKRLYAHHLQSVGSIGLHDPNAYNRANCMILCNSCHAAFHPLRRSGYGQAAWNQAAKRRGIRLTKRSQGR